MSRYLTTAPLRLILTIVLLAITASCDRCGGGTNGTETGPTPIEGVVPPNSPEEMSAAAAALLPANTPVFVAVRDPRAVTEGYAGIRPHLEAVLRGDLGMVETDLRNTLGIDLARATRLEESGVSAGAGFALTLVGDRLVGLVALSDPAVFHAKLSEVLQARPFECDAEVEEREIAGHTVHVFGKTDRGPEIAVAYVGAFAILLPRAGQGIDDTISVLLEEREESLADLDSFVASTEAAAFAHVHAYFNAESLLDERGEEITDELAGLLPEGTDPAAVADRLRHSGTLTAAITLGQDLLDVQLTQVPRGEAIEGFQRVTAADADPGFVAMATDDVYAFVRFTVAPQHLFSVVRGMLNESRQASLDSSVAELGEPLGVDIVTELLPALGSQACILFTRARLLTLSRAMNNGSPGEFFSGLGVVIAFELEDPALVRTTLENLVPTMDGRATSFEDDGRLVIEFTDAQADIGNLVLTENFALLVPARQRSDIMELLDANARELGWLDVADARGLVTEATANGLHLDMRRITDGPIGQVALARLPNQVKRLLGRTTRVTVSIDGGEDAIVSDLRIRFAAPDDE